MVGEEGPRLISRFLAWETGGGGTRHQAGEPKRRSGVGSEGKLGLGHIGFEIPWDTQGGARIQWIVGSQAQKELGLEQIRNAGTWMVTEASGVDCMTQGSCER